MFLAEVIGSVVATIKVDALIGAKLLVVRKVDRAGKLVGEPIVACDCAQAGAGDRVFCVSAREASHVMPDPFVPIDAAIVGIVDAVDRSECAS